jgi:hypothetical protein
MTNPLPSLSLAPLTPLQLLYGAFLGLVIVYASAIPDDIRLFADTLLGRILGILWVYLTVESMGWLFGLFTAMAFLTILYLSPHARWVNNGGSVEGFHGSSGVVEKERMGSRWFVERVLGENPVAISTEKVTTLPVQD